MSTTSGIINSLNLEKNDLIKQIDPNLQKYYELPQRKTIKTEFSKIQSHKRALRSREEVCNEVENLSRIERYNLKLLRLDNKNNITFCCSCSSKKHEKNLTIENQNDKEEEEDDDEVTEKKSKLRSTDDSYLDFEKSESLDKCKQNGKTRKTKVALVKRTNKESCKFRMIFQKNQNGVFRLKKISPHNHEPMNQFVSFKLIIFRIERINAKISNFL